MEPTLNGRFIWRLSSGRGAGCFYAKKRPRHVGGRGQVGQRGETLQGIGELPWEKTRVIGRGRTLTVWRGGGLQNSLTRPRLFNVATVPAADAFYVGNRGQDGSSGEGAG